MGEKVRLSDSTSLLYSWEVVVEKESVLENPRVTNGMWWTAARLPGKTDICKTKLIQRYFKRHRPFYTTLVQDGFYSQAQVGVSTNKKRSGKIPLLKALLFGERISNLALVPCVGCFGLSTSAIIVKARGMPAVNGSPLDLTKLTCHKLNKKSGWASITT